jgi:hypothetical protein
MAFVRKRVWRDWFREMFITQGLFSLRPLPVNRAEQDESDARETQETVSTRLDLKSDPEGSN